jgi:hypothetical protein
MEEIMAESSDESTVGAASMELESAQSDVEHGDQEDSHSDEEEAGDFRFGGDSIGTDDNDEMFKLMQGDSSSASESEGDRCPPPPRERSKKECPLLGCGKPVMNVTKHLRQKHKLSRGKAKQVFARNVESCRRLNSETGGRPYKDCHLCTSRVQRLDQHLIKTHKLPRGEVWRILRRRKLGEQEKIKKQVEADNLGEVLTEFSAHLQSFSGGRKPSRVAKQYCNGVNAVLAGVGLATDIDRLRTLVRQGGFVDEAVRNGEKQPGTVRAYLSALRQLYMYLKGEEGRKYDVTYQFADLATQEISNWMASLSKDVSKRRHNFQEDEVKILPEVARAMKSYPESDHFKRARLLFLSYTPFVPTSANEFTLMRDSLLVQIIIRNSQRSGAIANARTEAAESVTLRAGEYILKVSDHKTAHSYGAARLCLNEALHSHLAYLRRAGAEDKGFLFCSVNGQKLEGGRISRILKVALGTEVVSTTRMRKSVVVQAKEAGMRDHELRDLADHMSHSTQMQNKFYDIRNKELSSVTAVAGIERRQQQGDLVSIFRYYWLCWVISRVKRVGWLVGWLSFSILYDKFGGLRPHQNFSLFFSFFSGRAE